MNKSEVRIWELIRNTPFFKKLIKDYRSSLGIPYGGFRNNQKFRYWRYSKVDKDVYRKKLKEFLKKIDTELSMFNIEKVHKLAINNLYFANQTYTFSKFRYGLDFHYRFTKVKKMFPPGFYIKINPLASKSDLRKFIDESADFIRKIQTNFDKEFTEEYKKKNKPPAKNKKRDEIIYTLSLMSRDELKIMLPKNKGLSNNKDILIGNLLAEFGYKRKPTPDTIRTAIARESQKRSVTK